ncbi:unnamed protein product [Symbiodinium necroappetens]|uniref:SAM domain-containing protein n=1 Tax=Symbiodinium necroappetens TaxID=1628268 RepID=A0A812J8J9_9DINO|nr:unnamed protein product [Symbiodinium necroappetens]
MLKRGSTKPCDLDTYELDWDDLGKLGFFRMQLPSMPQKAPSASEPAPAPASAPAPGPVATQANPAEEWTLARLERKVMEEESFEKRRKSSSAMRALEECYEDAAWDSFDVSETAEVAPAQPMPLDVQVPQELRRPSEERLKLGESRPRAKETPPRGPPAMRPGQAPAAGPQRRVQCPAPGVPGGLAKASAKTPGPGPPPAVKHQSMQHPGAGPQSRMPAPTKYQAMPPPNPTPKVPGAKPLPGPLTKAPQAVMRPQAPGQPRFAPVQRQVVAPQMAVLGAMRAGTVPAHNLVPAHPHEAQPQLSTSQPDVRLVPQPTAYSQTQQLQGQQVEVMLMPQAALQQHEPQPQQVPPGPQADVKLVPQPQLNHAQPQPAVQPQEPLPRNPSEQAEVRALAPPMQHVPTGQAEFRPMQPNPHEAQPQMPGPQAQQLLPQSSRFVQDSSQATILYPSPASGFRPETQRQVAAAPAVLGQSSLEAPSESEKQAPQTVEMSDGTPVAPAAQAVMGGSCATNVASANGSRGPDRMLNKLLAQPCSTRLQTLQRTGYVSPLPPGPQVTLAHPTYPEAGQLVAAPPDAGNLPESVALPLQFEAVEEYPGFQVPMAPRAAQAPMCGSASVPTAPWVFARPQTDVLSRSAAQLPVQAPPQRQGVPPPPSRSDSAPVVGLCEPITLAAAEPRASAEPVAIAVAADNDALSGFADPAEVGKPVRDWTEDDVAQWLMKLSTVPADILDVVHLHAISGAVLLSMTEEDLEGLRIEKFGHRRLIVKLLSQHGLTKLVARSDVRKIPLLRT